MVSRRLSQSLPQNKMEIEALPVGDSLEDSDILSEYTVLMFRPMMEQEGEVSFFPCIPEEMVEVPPEVPWQPAHSLGSTDSARFRETPSFSWT